MADTLDLTGEIAEAVNGAALRGKTLALAYIDGDGYPVASFRGSAQVHGAQQLAVWARKRDSGFAAEIAAHPEVSLVYYGGPDGPGPALLSFRGRARVEPEANDEVYAQMIPGEQAQDPDREGVAVIVEVDSVRGFGADGAFTMERGGGS